MRLFQRNSTRHPYFSAGLTAFLVLAAAILFWTILSNFDGFLEVMAKIRGVFSPVAMSIVFAYLVNPLVHIVDDRLLPRLQKTKLKPVRAARLSRAAGVVFAWALVLFVIVLLLRIVLPQLVESVATIAGSLGDYYNSIQAWIAGHMSKAPDAESYISGMAAQLYTRLQDWMQNGVVNNAQILIAGLTNSVITGVHLFVNILIGIIVSFYILMSREMFLAQAKKLVCAIWKPARANRIMQLGRDAHRIFGKFVTGKILDSLIIGVLAFIILWMFKFPFPVLMAVIIGCTNIIPFFGPFIGAIPCAILVFFVNPIQCLYFVIFIFILQQIDGNIIGPRILGEATGLSGFWIVTAITVFGGFFGFLGMLVGVPVFAILYLLVKEWATDRVAERGKTAETAAYLKIRNFEDLADGERDDAAEDETTTMK